MLKSLLFLCLIYQSNAHYLPPNSYGVPLGAFQCDSSFITIYLAFSSDTTNVNFVSYPANSDLTCGSGQYIYVSLSVIGVQSFAGTLSKNISYPLCFAFQNPDQVYSTNIDYRMDVECGNIIIPPATIIQNSGNASLVVSIVFNCLFVIAIITGILYVIKLKKSMKNTMTNTSNIVAPIAIIL